jgi:hypothetical protein
VRNVRRRRRTRYRQAAAVREVVLPRRDARAEAEDPGRFRERKRRDEAPPAVRGRQADEQREGAGQSTGERRGLRLPPGERGEAERQRRARARGLLQRPPRGPPAIGRECDAPVQPRPRAQPGRGGRRARTLRDAEGHEGGRSGEMTDPVAREAQPLVLWLARPHGLSAALPVPERRRQQEARPQQGEVARGRQPIEAAPSTVTSPIITPHAQERRTATVRPEAACERAPTASRPTAVRLGTHKAGPCEPCAQREGRRSRDRHQEREMGGGGARALGAPEEDERAREERHGARELASTRRRGERQQVERMAGEGERPPPAARARVVAPEEEQRRVHEQRRDRDAAATTTRAGGRASERQGLRADGRRDRRGAPRVARGQPAVRATGGPRPSRRARVPRRRPETPTRARAAPAPRRPRSVRRGAPPSRAPPRRRGAGRRRRVRPRAVRPGQEQRDASQRASAPAPTPGGPTSASVTVQIDARTAQPRTTPLRALSASRSKRTRPAANTDERNQRDRERRRRPCKGEPTRPRP